MFGKRHGRGPGAHFHERFERHHERHHGPHEERQEHHHGPHEERQEHHNRHWFSPRGRGPFGPPWGGGGPFGGGPFSGDPFGEDGGRKRSRRGDIRFWLLELIAEQPRHGYELIKALEERYGGFYRPSPGSIYPTLQLLEDEGHLTSETLDGKRVYTITESGSKLLSERDEQQRESRGGRGPWRGMSPELHGLRQNTMALAEGVMQVARHGTPEQARAAAQVLERTRREIYALLAQDAPEQTQ